MRTSCSAVNRGPDWDACCASVYGWNVQDDIQREASRSNVTLVNLVVDQHQHHNKTTTTELQEKNPTKRKNKVDTTTDDGEFLRQAIQEIQDNMDRMISWLEEKKWAYLLPQTTRQEASLIQSTIGSYTVTTANELERLRRHMMQHNDKTASYGHAQQQQHDMTVIQILSERLKERVAEPFGKIQKQRQRAAVDIWQNPLSCRFVPSLTIDKDDDEEDEMDRVLGLDKGTSATVPTKDRRFVPTQPNRVWRHDDFLDSYHHQNDSNPPERPVTFLSRRWKRPRSPGKSPTSSIEQQEPNQFNEKPTGKIFPTPQQQPQSKRSKVKENEQQYHVVNDEELRQESTMLQMQHQQHDLDAVQTMETTMVQITALLTQFSELVSHQQEEVLQIQDAVSTSKKNVEQGQEQLVDATQRTEGSKHYMASAITAMGMALLFFHWIRP